MRSYGIILLAALSAAAQEPPEPPLAAPAQAAPPKELDDALRARVSQFYQAHVDRKLRLAMEVVADESKDYFLEIDKPRYFGFKIATVSYSDEFTRADVVVNCDGEFTALPQGRMKVTMPLTSRWKLVDGNWYWFAEPAKARQTPFGPMQPGTGGPPAGGLPQPGMGGLPKAPALPSGPQNISADKTGVVLNPARASSDVVTLSNTIDGWITVEVTPPEVPGLTLRVEKKDIPPGGTGRIVFDYTPESKPPQGLKVFLRIIPIGQAIPIGVAFTAPAEAQAATPQPAAPQKQPGQTQPPKKPSQKR